MASASTEVKKSAIHQLLSALRGDPVISTANPCAGSGGGGKSGCVTKTPCGGGSQMSDDETARISSYLSAVNPACPSFDSYRAMLGHSDTYTRHLLACEPGFSVLLMVWGPGHATPVHNHGRGVASWVRVLSGSLRLETPGGDTTSPGDCGGGQPTASSSKPACEMAMTNVVDLEAGSDVRVIPEGFGYHRLGNPSAKVTAVSLHVYSPPLVECCVEGPESPGLAPRKRLLPVVYGPSRACADTAERYDLVRRGVSNVPLYPNFEALTTILSAEIAEGGGASHTPEHIQYISGLLGAMRFNPDEWLQYSKFVNNRYTRNLVGYHDKFTVLILCWEKGQESPVHDHAGSSCWVKVLEGCLTETRYRMPTDEERASGAPLVVESESEFASEGVAYINDSMGLHKMGNQSMTQRCVTLHVYSPPYRSCNCYDVLTSKARHVPVTAESGVYHKFMDPELAARNASATTDLQRLMATIDDTFLTAQRSGAGRVPTTEVQAILDNFNFRPEEWRRYVHFSEHRYIRALLGSTDRFSLFLNCWNTEQCTPPHTHGSTADDPRVWIKVLEGVVAMTRYPNGDPNDEDDARVRLLNSGTPATCFDHRIGLHSASNPSSEHTAVSLHVYSPPYMHCVSVCKTVQVPISYCNPAGSSNLSSRRGTVEDQASDAGNNGEGLVSPMGLVPRASRGLGSDSDDEGSGGGGKIVGGLTSVCLRSDIADGHCSAGQAFECLSTFTDLVRGEIARGPDGLGERITRLLRTVNLPPSEIDTYAPPEATGPAGGASASNYKRTLVSFGKGFSVYLMCFSQGHASPVHTHGQSRGWLKVLRGKVHEVTHAKAADGTMYEQGVKVIGEGDVSEMPVGVLHKLSNHFEPTAYTLHIYTPPLSEEEFHRDVQ